MPFEVRPNKKRRRNLFAAQILCVVMIAGILWVLNWDIMAEYWRDNPGAYWLFVGFIAIFVLFLFFLLYTKRRPMIRADNQTVTFYTMFRPAKRVAWSEIKRKAEADRTYRQAGAAAATMAGGIIGYSIYKKAAGIDPNAPLDSYPRQYTYYQGNKKLIVIRTS